jgi:hypothetical protein
MNGRSLRPGSRQRVAALELRFIQRLCLDDRPALVKRAVAEDFGPWGPGDAVRPPQLRRRHAYLLRFRRPEGKLIKIVAAARSDEHIFYLGAGRATKSGQPVSAAGGYSRNPDGLPHSAIHIVRALYGRAGRGEVGRSPRCRERRSKTAMTGHPVLTLRAMRDRRAEDVITGRLADFNAKWMPPKPPISAGS